MFVEGLIKSTAFKVSLAGACLVSLLGLVIIVEQETDRFVDTSIQDGKGFLLKPTGTGGERFRVNISYSVWGRRGSEAKENAFKEIRLRTGCEIGSISDRYDQLINPGVYFDVTTNCG